MDSNLVHKHQSLIANDCSSSDSHVSVSKIVRVIRQPRGNMLLIGIGGSGRQSLTRLAAHICEYHTFQIEISKHYRKNEFRDGKSSYAQLETTCSLSFTA